MGVDSVCVREKTYEISTPVWREESASAVVDWSRCNEFPAGCRVVPSAFDVELARSWFVGVSSMWLCACVTTRMRDHM